MPNHENYLRRKHLWIYDCDNNFMRSLFAFRYELLTVANQKQSKSLGDLLEMVSSLVTNRNAFAFTFNA